jgi:type VI secretion system protein ImpE
MSVIDGPDGEVFIPAIYPPAGEAIDAQFRLGRATDFAGPQNGPLRGKGLRSFLIGEDSKTILELGKIEFAR